MTSADTKTTILDAAETLFAEQGYAATSLRELTTKARVNLAAVHYHFGGKEDLAKAVLARRIEPINEERLRRLDAITGRPSVEAVVRAFVEPPLRSAPQPAGSASRTSDDMPARGFCRVFGRISVEQPPFLRDFLGRQFGEVARRFSGALQQAMRGHTAPTMWWRLHFVIGAMAHTMQNAAALSHVSGNLCDADDVDEIIEQLVHFAVGGVASADPGRRTPTKRKTTVKRKVTRLKPARARSRR